MEELLLLSFLAFFLLRTRRYQKLTSKLLRYQTIDKKSLTPFFDVWLLTTLNLTSSFFHLLVPTSVHGDKKASVSLPLVLASDWIHRRPCSCTWILTLAHPLSSIKNPGQAPFLLSLMSQGIFHLLERLPFLFPNTSIIEVKKPLSCSLGVYMLSSVQTSELNLGRGFICLCRRP